MAELRKNLLEKNKIYTLRIETMCGNGSGIGHIDGCVVFVPCAAEGDLLSVRIIKNAKNYSIGKIEEIIEQSPHRIADGCPLMAKCGGCTFAHIDYEVESKIKRDMINDSFSHIAGLELSLDEFYPAPDVCHYRNKAIYPIGVGRDGRIICGFYASMSHRIVEHNECLIGNKIFSQIKDKCVEFFEKHSLSVYDEESGKGLLRSIYMRSSEGGDVLLTLVVNGKGLGESAENSFVSCMTEAFSEICGIVINVNTKSGNSVLGDDWRTLYGDGYLYDTLCGKKFRIAPAAFYQVNHEQAQRLYMKAKEFADIKEGETLFDLYCGTGTIGIVLAEKGVKLVGVEISKEATVDARYNAQQNGVDGEFLCLDASRALDAPELLAKKPDCIVIDPPRKGCGEESARKISAFGAKRIVYISCNPSTLARDLKAFYECGYLVEKSAGFDLFPRTGHCECVALLTRRNI